MSPTVAWDWRIINQAVPLTEYWRLGGNWTATPEGLCKIARIATEREIARFYGIVVDHRVSSLARFWDGRFSRTVVTVNPKNTVANTRRRFSPWAFECFSH